MQGTRLRRIYNVRLHTRNGTACKLVIFRAFCRQCEFGNASLCVACCLLRRATPRSQMKQVQHHRKACLQHTSRPRGQPKGTIPCPASANMSNGRHCQWKVFSFRWQIQNLTGRDAQFTKPSKRLLRPYTAALCRAGLGQLAENCVGGSLSVDSTQPQKSSADLRSEPSNKCTSTCSWPDQVAAAVSPQDAATRYRSIPWFEVVRQSRACVTFLDFSHHAPCAPRLRAFKANARPYPGRPTLSTLHLPQQRQPETGLNRNFHRGRNHLAASPPRSENSTPWWDSLPKHWLLNHAEQALLAQTAKLKLKAWGPASWSECSIVAHQ